MRFTLDLFLFTNRIWFAIYVSFSYEKDTLYWFIGNLFFILIDFSIIIDCFYRFGHFYLFCGEGVKKLCYKAEVLILKYIGDLFFFWVFMHFERFLITYFTVRYFLFYIFLRISFEELPIIRSLAFSWKVIKRAENSSWH